MGNLLRNVTRPKAGKLIKATLSCALIGTVLVLLSDYLAETDPKRLRAALGLISPWAILGSGVLTAISLFAVAGYDRLAARQMGLRIPDSKTQGGGFAAVALSQAAGFGMITGSFVRWRMYRGWGVTYPQAALLTGLVLVGFSIGFLAVLAAAVLAHAEIMTGFTGLSAITLRALAGLGLLTVAGIVLLSILQPQLRVFGRPLPIPKFRLIRAQIGLAACDLVPAAAALWILIPEVGGVSLAAVIPVYLVALAFGMVSNMPGGLGVLELACLMALPVMPPENLLAALIVYRGVYYAVPALLAAAMLAAREFGNNPDIAPVSERAPARSNPSRAAQTYGHSNRAEAMYARLDDKHFWQHHMTSWMYGTCGNSLVTLGDPLGPEAHWPDTSAQFAELARTRDCAPVHYKISEPFARRLEAQGYHLARTGMDGILSPQSFTTKGSKFSRLRRSLRQAEKAGVQVFCHAPGDADVERLAPVAQEWAEAKGGERRFSMGYWDQAYLKDQPIVEARVEGETTGFISLAYGQDQSEFALDLVRLAAAAEPGTAQVLTLAAIDMARAAGAERFSLGSVPLKGLDQAQNLSERGLIQVRDRYCDGGLMQFKSAFRPDWVQTYSAAPSQLALATGLWDTYRLIHPAGPMVRASTHPTASSVGCVMSRTVSLTATPLMRS